MTAPYLLDTNVYCEFFQKTPPTSFAGLRARLLSGKTCSFYISEITSMEVYSVLGKYRRGRPTQLQKCERTVLVEGEEQVCSHVWRWAGTKRISLRLIRSLHKLVSDTEKGKGDIQATVLGVDDDTVRSGRDLLRGHAHKYSFGSHDALIAGCLVAMKRKGLDLTLVTHDRGLKAALRDEGLPHWDPAD